jgi:hypothetical protein
LQKRPVTDLTLQVDEEMREQVLWALGSGPTIGCGAYFIIEILQSQSTLTAPDLVSWMVAELGDKVDIEEVTTRGNKGLILGGSNSRNIQYLLSLNGRSFQGRLVHIKQLCLGQNAQHYGLHDVSKLRSNYQKRIDKLRKRLLESPAPGDWANFEIASKIGTNDELLLNIARYSVVRDILREAIQEQVIAHITSSGKGHFILSNPQRLK